MIAGSSTTFAPSLAAVAEMTPVLGRGLVSAQINHWHSRAWTGAPAPPHLSGTGVTCAALRELCRRNWSSDAQLVNGVSEWEAEFSMLQGGLESQETLGLFN